MCRNMQQRMWSEQITLRAIALTPTVILLAEAVLTALTLVYRKTSTNLILIDDFSNLNF